MCCACVQLLNRTFCLQPFVFLCAMKYPMLPLAGMVHHGMACTVSARDSTELCIARKKAQGRSRRAHSNTAATPFHNTQQNRHKNFQRQGQRDHRVRRAFGKRHPGSSVTFIASYGHDPHHSLPMTPTMTIGDYEALLRGFLVPKARLSEK